MIRYIKIEDANKRDAEITFKSVKSGDLIYLALENGEKPINKRVIKSTSENSIEHLIGKNEPTQEDYNSFSEKLIENDSEIDFELFGKYVDKTDKIYTNTDLKPVYNVTITEQILNTEGELVEEKEQTFNKSNINGDSTVRWTGKYIPKNKIYNKIVLSSKYQLKHINGLTFDFLFNVAKDLHEKDSLMMLGGGKGNEPLTINDGGRPYRAFLEGKVKENSYCLIMHFSNQEYKAI
tara:strand:+ start:638 stop:1345 length:708 start_codon:yes stop_codon:yes gene_type:complete